MATAKKGNVHLSLLKPHSSNPRKISADDFEKLKRSLQRDPEIMTVNPIVLNGRKDLTILAGEQRHKALTELGYKDIPANWILYADGLTDEQKQKLIILDNHHSGKWDKDKLQELWDIEVLQEWELEIPEFKIESDPGDAFNDTGIKAQNQYGVIVMCDSEEHQEKTFTLLEAQGYKCKIVVT